MCVCVCGHKENSFLKYNNRIVDSLQLVRSSADSSVLCLQDMMHFYNILNNQITLRLRNYLIIDYMKQCMCIILVYYS